MRDSHRGMTAAAGYAELAGGGHLTTTGDAGGFRGALTAWFRWQLMGDPIARDQFVGPEPAIATSPQWNRYETNPQLQALGAEAEAESAEAAATAGHRARADALVAEAQEAPIPPA